MTTDELDIIRRRLAALPDAAPTLQRLVDAIDERDARIAALEAELARLPKSWTKGYATPVLP